MNYRIVTMLEAIKLCTYSNENDYLNDGDIQLILSWYAKYTQVDVNRYDIEKAIDLLYALYIRENLTLYPVEEFQCVVDQLSFLHSFEKMEIWNILSDFEKLVYGEQ